MHSWYRTMTCFCLLASVVLTVCLGNTVQSSLAEEERQEIATLAARIVKIVMNNNAPFYTNGKRNAGTIDTLFQIPDLLSVGKR